MVSFIQSEQYSTLPKISVALLKHCTLTPVLCNLGSVVHFALPRVLVFYLSVNKMSFNFKCQILLFLCFWSLVLKVKYNLTYNACCFILLTQFCLYKRCVQFVLSF
jgi:hypothetical protein